MQKLEEIAVATVLVFLAITSVIVVIVIELLQNSQIDGTAIIESDPPKSEKLEDNHVTGE